MPRVYNKHHKDAPDDAIYVGRPTVWGNPFSHLPGGIARFRVGTRKRAIECYAEWIKTQPKLLAQLPELRGKDLVCWCYPQPCHAEVLLNLANKELQDETTQGR
jgi:hypothetical protein